MRARIIDVKGKIKDQMDEGSTCQCDHPFVSEPYGTAQKNRPNDKRIVHCKNLLPVIRVIDVAENSGCWRFENKLVPKEHKIQ